jgi:hypothetical protein
MGKHLNLYLSLQVLLLAKTVTIQVDRDKSSQADSKLAG